MEPGSPQSCEVTDSVGGNEWSQKTWTQVLDLEPPSRSRTLSLNLGFFIYKMRTARSHCEDYEARINNAHVLTSEP